MNHRLFPTFCSACAVLTASAEAANAQTQTRQLTLGTPIVRELTAAERHAYAVSVDSGQFVLVTVQQQGIDVYVSLLDRRGNVVATGRDRSGRNGRNGLDSVSLFSDYSGWHWVAVLPRTETNDKAPASPHEWIARPVGPVDDGGVAHGRCDYGRSDPAPRRTTRHLLGGRVRRVLFELVER